MPLTFLAHQAPVIPLKIARPRWFDGTALCIGSLAPDLTYPLGPLGRIGHRPLGLLLWTVPVTLLLTRLLRRGGAATLFAHVPDLGPLRLRSYGVLSERAPAFAITLLSAFIGGLTHILLDAFTHTNRWGARLMGWDTVIGEVPLRGETTVAGVLQYLGHTLGSAACIALLWVIARRRLLERWYGEEAVAGTRAATVSASARWRFTAGVLAGVGFGFLWATLPPRGALPFRLIDGAVLGVVLACALSGLDAGRSPGPEREDPAPSGAGSSSGS